MYRIYFDGNEAAEDGRENLGIPGSHADIQPIESQLTNGEHVLLYDHDGREVEAIIEFDGRLNSWMARPIWETLRVVEHHTTLR
jgi:hypothetical protein